MYFRLLFAYRIAYSPSVVKSSESAVWGGRAGCRAGIALRAPDGRGGHGQAARRFGGGQCVLENLEKTSAGLCLRCNRDARSGTPIRFDRRRPHSGRCSILTHRRSRNHRVRLRIFLEWAAWSPWFRLLGYSRTLASSMPRQAQGDGPGACGDVTPKGLGQECEDGWQQGNRI